MFRNKIYDRLLGYTMILCKLNQSAVGSRHPPAEGAEMLRVIFYGEGGDAECSEAIERYEVPLDLLNAATRLSITTSWCSSTSQCSVFNNRCAVFQRLTAFNPHFMGFKHLTSFGVQFQICGFQWVTGILF
jgi:hypothetical protein